MAHYVVDFLRSVYHRLSNFGGSNSNSDDEPSSESEVEWLKMHVELQIRKCSSPKDMFDVIPECVYELFPKVRYCHVYLQLGTLQDSAGQTFPTDAFASQLMSYRGLKQNLRVSTDHEFYDILSNGVRQDLIWKLGLSYLPIFDQRRRRKTVAALVYVGEELELGLEENELLRMLTSSIAESCQTMQARYHASTVDLLSNMCTIDDNIAQGQLTVVQHLKNETDADCAFLLTYNKYDDDFVLKTFDDKIIAERRFPCHTLPSFYARINQSKPILSSYAADTRNDIITVGTRISAKQCVIAPIKQNTQTIGFVVLLSRIDRFTQEDLDFVEASLSLSGSLLYKDMIVERERILREQTEKLHQVAKNIFTHLGERFDQLLKENYQRLLDHVVVPDVPSAIQATLHTSHYKNVYIPPISCQRLISLDDRLVVVGAASKHYQQSATECWSRHDRRDSSSGTVDCSSIINTHETGYQIFEIGPNEEEAEYDFPLQHTREKREYITLNLGDISEEVETSMSDTVVPAAEAVTPAGAGLIGNKSSTPIASLPMQSRLLDMDTDEPGRLVMDANNNADRDETSKKHSKSSKISASFSQLGAQSRSSDDVVSQLLGAAADVPATARTSRGSVAYNRRPSALSMSSRGAQNSRSNLISRSRKASGIKQPSNKKSGVFLAHTGPAVSLDRSRTVDPDNHVNYQPKTFRGRLSKVSSNTGFCNQMSAQCLPPLTEGNVYSSYGSVSNDDVLPFTAEQSDHTGSGSNVTSKDDNDSIESFDLRNFQAALKKDFHVPGQTLIDREKAMLHSILEYKRRSLLEEGTRSEKLDSLGSVLRAKHDQLEALDARQPLRIGKPTKGIASNIKTLEHESKVFSARPKFSLGIIKDVLSDKDLCAGTKSHDRLLSRACIVKSQRTSSQSSMIDVSTGHGKSKAGIMDSPLRKSVLNLDMRARETHDTRFSTADKIERGRGHSTSYSAIGNEFLSMAVSAADGASGPFRSKSSVESNLRLGTSIAESRIVDHLNVRFDSQRWSGRTFRSDETGQVGHKDVASFDKAVQYDIQNDSIESHMHHARRSAERYHSVDLSVTPPLATGGLSDGASQFHLITQARYTQNSRLETPRRSISFGDQSSNYSPQLLVTAPIESLTPLIRTPSGTVVLSLKCIANARYLSKRSAVSLKTLQSTESDIESLLGENWSACASASSNIDAQNKSGNPKAGKRKKKLVDVEVINIYTNERKLFAWHGTTLKLCKFSPIAQRLGIDDNDLTVLLKEIMQEARNLCHAERCSVFLLEDEANELVAKVFDGDIVPSEEVRISATEGIAGHVVQTGKILNIKDAYSHPLFFRGVDEATGFKTRNILCFPIKDERDNTIGAAQLCNKIGSPHFDSTDEVIAKALATYCCISIVNSLMYRDVLDAHNRVKLANELMMFHMHVPPHEVVELMKQPVVPMTAFGDDLCLQELQLSIPRNMEPASTPMAVVSMAHELEFVQNFKIKSHTLARFVLMVKKGYRDPPYHNWSHAFSVAHFAYLLLRNLKCVANGIFDELEALAFFVAALCHDIDHRGTSNSFQVASNSVLAALYSSEGSVMERHHFSQTLCILNTEGCNIFENTSRKEYEQLLDLIRDIILSTDIAHHLRIRGGLEAMAEQGFDKHDPEQKSLLLCLFMTSADLSDQTKPWRAAKRVSKLLYKEFFSQGDLEKALGRNPMEMMDRERASIPDLQIGFIDHIVLPAFSALRTAFPITECLVTNITENREHWLTIKNKTADRRDSITSLDVFDFIDAEDERESNGELDHDVM